MLEKLYDYSNELMELALAEVARARRACTVASSRDATLHRFDRAGALQFGGADHVGVQPLLDA